MQPYYVKKKNNKSLFYIKLISIVLICIFWSRIRFFISPMLSDSFVKVFNSNNVFIHKYNDLLLYIKDRREMNDKINKLSIDNIYLENEIAKYKYNESQDKLKNEMVNNGKVDSIIAYSLGSKDNWIYDNFIINAGYRDGAYVGAMVYTRGMQPVGRIDQVNNNTSRVRLLSINGDEVECILEINNEKVTLIGSGGGEYTTKVKNSLLSNGYGVGNKVLLGEDTSMVIGEIVHVDPVKDEDASLLHIRGYYNPASQTIFFVDK